MDSLDGREKIKFDKIYTSISIISSEIDGIFVYGGQVLPDSIAGLQKLQRLDISSNLLESLPDSIGVLINLKVVIVSGNKLKVLPETITGCRYLNPEAHGKYKYNVDSLCCEF